MDSSLSISGGGGISGLSGPGVGFQQGYVKGMCDTVGGWQVQLVSNLVDLPPDGEWTDKPGTGQPETDVLRRQPIARLVWRGR